MFINYSKVANKHWKVVFKGKTTSFEVRILVVILNRMWVWEAVKNVLADFVRLGGTPPTHLTENQCEKRRIFSLADRGGIADFPAVFFHISHWYLSWNTAGGDNCI